MCPLRLSHLLALEFLLWDLFLYDWNETNPLWELKSIGEGTRFLKKHTFQTYISPTASEEKWNIKAEFFFWNFILLWKLLFKKSMLGDIHREERLNILFSAPSNSLFLCEIVSRVMGLQKVSSYSCTPLCLNLVCSLEAPQLCPKWPFRLHALTATLALAQPEKHSPSQPPRGCPWTSTPLSVPSLPWPERQDNKPHVFWNMVIKTSDLYNIPFKMYQRI